MHIYYQTLILKKLRYLILEKLKNVKYNDFEDLVFRFQITYDEIIDIKDLK